MMERISIHAVLALVCLLPLKQTTAGKKPADENLPNILFILIDDMGWKDISCSGSSYYETPNIDKLASEGIRFLNAYSPAPVCTPTRGAIFSGGIWLLLGLVGLPVFSAGSGLLYLLGPTGGYILGFLAVSIILPPVIEKGRGLGWYILCFSLAAVFIYGLGIIGIIFSLKVSLGQALAIGFSPFIYAASLKITLAGLIARLVRG